MGVRVCKPMVHKPNKHETENRDEEKHTNHICTPYNIIIIKQYQYHTKQQDRDPEKEKNKSKPSTYSYENSDILRPLHSQCVYIYLIYVRIKKNKFHC